jgi:D-alanyl-lipoteichoic acid acyltransferase DltB (MBOAT superfamily)
MLFSNPDYPLFLIAVWFLYALSRSRDALGNIARAAVMVLLGDLVFLLVSKDLDALWDPIGGILLRAATAGGDDPAWTEWTVGMLVRWVIGLGVLWGAIAAGRRGGAWIASDRGQRIIARGIVGVLVAVGVTVAIASSAGELDAVTDAITAHGHLLVLIVLGVGIGASQSEAHRPLGRVIVLFVASSLFYQAWAAAMPGPYRYLLALLLGTIVLDFYLGIWIERTENPLARKALLVVSLCSNLGILVFFKYTDFFTQDVLHLPVRKLHLILPAGISFHTFQSLSYTIDVYRRKLKATHSVVKFATFVLFFPQLVAGPIVRAQDLLPQLDQLPALEMEKATDGLFRIVVGLFKKIALADTLALVIVDRVFEAPERFSSLEVLAGVYAYALQIYLDFSAYSDIAIGSAQLLGFTLPENFRTPYRSANLQEFWRRWHISLSTWLRDYVYIALGGSKPAAPLDAVGQHERMRSGITFLVSGGLLLAAGGFRVWAAVDSGTWLIPSSMFVGAVCFFRGLAQVTSTHIGPRTYVNLILTMLIGGLWHGASWAFIVWGALHGFGLAITRYFQRATADKPKEAWTLLAGCGLIALVGFGFHWLAMTGTGTWMQLVLVWLYLTPLWAVLTAWLGADEVPVARPVAEPALEGELAGEPYRGFVVPPEGTYRTLSRRRRRTIAVTTGMTWSALFAVVYFVADAHSGLVDPDVAHGFVVAAATVGGIAFVVGMLVSAPIGDALLDPARRVPELLRLGMLASGIAFLVAIAVWSTEAGLPFAVLCWGLALAADLVEHRVGDFNDWLFAICRRTLAVALVFHYVCLAWVFFRATSFDNALAVLRQVAMFETDHANLVPIVTVTLVVGFLCHFFANGSFRWLRDRFVTMPLWRQGLVLAGCVLVLRELGHAKLVPFIYFQF